jgi:anaerobic ribonucleoside-triphosphate reductase
MKSTHTTPQKNENMQNLSGARTRCEIWTRVMGYHRPVSHFNVGKKAEHYSRKHFQQCIEANDVFTQKYSHK